MFLDDLLQTGRSLHIYYNEGNRHNCLIHIRAIVDDDMIVSRRWLQHKQRWAYEVQFRYFYETHAQDGHIVELTDAWE